MNGAEVIAELRRLCRDIDIGRRLEPIGWKCILAPVVVPVAFAVANGCGSPQEPLSEGIGTPVSVASPADGGNANGGVHEPDASASAHVDSSNGLPVLDGSPTGPPQEEDRAELPRGIPTIRASEVTVVYGSPFPREVIRRQIRRHNTETLRCAEPWLDANPGLEGRLVLRWRIDGNGAVSDVEVQSSTLDDPTVEQCVVEVIREMRFPAPGGGGDVTVTYPFVLSRSR